MDLRADEEALGPAPTGVAAVRARRRTAVALFVTLLGVYGYFFQGGGWNQNSRIAQVRAVVERGSFAIDDYLVYRNVGHRHLAREPVPPGTAWQVVAQRASSADVAVSPSSGLIYPNKPPGTTLAAAPAYAAILVLERFLGADPDAWWTLTLNSHLLTLLSVGLAGALTGVVLLRVSCALFAESPLSAHAGAAMSCGLATLMLPYSTVMFDHVLAAFWTLLAFAALVVEGGTGRRPFLGGLAAGAATLTNYACAGLAALLFLYLLRKRRLGDAARFVAGLLPVLLLLGWYQWACFGSPLAIANLYQNRAFTTEGRLLGVFSWPDPDVLWRLLFGRERGLLVTSPVLALAGLGLFRAWRPGRRAELGVAVGCFLALWLFNGAFNAWQAGWTIGPRYLVPAIPFLALGLTPAFTRLPRLTAALACASAAVLLLVTAVDVQPPRQVHNPVSDYLWPLWRGSAVRLYPGLELRGPVSANPIGVYEGWYYQQFPAGSHVSRWNSFNLGELLWPSSRLSLLPLLAWLGTGLAVTRARARASH